MVPTNVVRGRQNPLHWKFPERLRRARCQSEMSALALSAAAGVGRNTVSMMEEGSRVPRLPMVEHLARVLSVSPAWLAFGCTEPCEASTQLHSLELRQRVRAARVAQGLTLREVGRRAGSSASAIRSLEAGSMPTLDTLEELATALGVSPSWLAYGVGLMRSPKRVPGGARPDDGLRSS